MPKNPGKKQQEEKPPGVMKKMSEKLADSPINYFSDLFVVAMVIGWIAVLVIMVIMAIYSTVVLQIVDIWSYVWELTGIPLTAGGAVWMIKNTVQHNIANKQGRQCPQDFPAVNDSIEIDGQEKPMEFASGGGENDSSDDTGTEPKPENKETEEEACG